uniref:Zona pellucida sperm-binding protein 3 n=1 Tax=Echeneis naucrates TaxID=173247 RepID=A0A665TIC6_ECHNA
MNRHLQRSSWWIIALLSACRLAESRIVYSRGPGVENSRATTTFHGSQEQQQQYNTELGERPRPVSVRCHPDSMEVVVQADLFDVGLRVDGTHLRLGAAPAARDGPCRGVQSGVAEVTVRTPLTECGTQLSSTEEKIIYSNSLVYSPEASADGLLRLEEATIPVECHYERYYALDGLSLRPTWHPFVSTIAAEDQIDFTLQLMTDDWQFERRSYSYFLGDTINFEITSVVADHMPLRVYVDHCVATATTDAEDTLRYDFIEHHGCLTDTYLTNSSSRFLPRIVDHKLRFQLEAFRFYQEPRNQVYLTCYVKAVPVMLTVDSQNRACSLIQDRWQSVDGDDLACSSCSVPHQFLETTTEPPTTTVGTKAWSLMTSQESFVQSRDEQHPARYVRFRPKIQQNQHKKLQSLDRLLKRGTDNTAEKTMQLGPLIVLPSRKFVTKPTDANVTLSKKN